VTRTGLEIPEPVRRKALAEGRVGEAWLAGLVGTVLDLADEWGLSLGRTLAGSTEAFVAEVMTADRRPAVLKVDRPGRDPSAGELRTLLAAQGRGYAEVYAYDRACGAILLERLGPQLAELGLSISDKLAILCATLQEAWTIPPEGERFVTGAEKAEGLARFIEVTWLETGRPCSEQTIERALAYAESRRRAFEEDAVLAHGDAHCWNVLLVPGSRLPRFKFVDPDGLFIERAYDLGISMREWAEDLLAGDPVVLGLRRCQRLADLTSVNPGPIWEWGFVERVSTGLLNLRVGLDGAREMLAVADAWAKQSPP